MAPDKRRAAIIASTDELVSACVHDAFETEALRGRLLEIDRELPLRERLAEAVSTMQDYLRGIFSLMSVLQATGQQLHRPHKGEDPRRRLPPLEVVNYLRMITLSSVHPMLNHQDSSAQELVDVILEGALVRPDDARSSDSKGARRAAKGKN